VIINFEQINKKKENKMLRLVQKYNSNHFDAETGTIEGDEDKGLPVKLFPENEENVPIEPERLMKFGMN
jgi:hypothetical protein